MVQISHETQEQIDIRLKKVISESDFKTYEETYTFEEFPLDQLESNVSPNAIALVRDSELWSQLVPSNDSKLELFTVFSFHFDNCSDNSGFVGWLASRLKQELGTGVFVTCGQNSKRGGIFDYWGCPVELGEQAIELIRNLIFEGGRI